MIILLAVFLPRILSLLGSLILSPVIAVESWLQDSQSTVPAYFRDRDELLQEQQDLKRLLAERDGVAYTADALEAENKLLKNLQEGETTERIPASVIGRPTKLPYDVLVIDKGENDGVQKHAPIFAGKTHVIGFVGEVYEQTAVVILSTTPGVESTVYIYGPNIYTTGVGQGGGVLQVQVPQGILLEVGNTVAMPVFETAVFGEIKTIESIPTQPEQYGYVSSDIPLQSLRYVSVGKAPIDAVSFEKAQEIVKNIENTILKVPVPENFLIDVNSTSTASTTVGTTTEISNP